MEVHGEDALNSTTGTGRLSPSCVATWSHYAISIAGFGSLIGLSNSVHKSEQHHPGALIISLAATRQLPMLLAQKAVSLLEGIDFYAYRQRVLESRNRSPDPNRWLSLQFFDSMALCKPQPLFSILTLSCFFVGRTGCPLA
jgi:hypothetical protein